MCVNYCLMAASAHPSTPLLCKHINTDKLLLSYVHLHQFVFSRLSPKDSPYKITQQNDLVYLSFIRTKHECKNKNTPTLYFKQHVGLTSEIFF